MNNEERCASYLKEKQLQDFMLGIRKRFASYGRFTGKVSLHGFNEKQCEDISRILGKKLSSTDAISVKEFISALQQSSFGNVDFKQVLDLYFNETVLTAKQKQENKKQDDLSFYSQLQDIADKYTGGKGRQWLETMSTKKDSGFRTLSRLRKEDETKALHIWECICKGTEIISKEECIGNEIAIFSSAISGNPHFLDRNSDGASLLVSYLCYLYGTALPEKTNDLYDLFSRAGLVKNEIAGSVAIYNLHLFKNNHIHEGIEGCYQYKESFMLTFQCLNRMDTVKAYAQKVYVFENEMVYTHVQKEMKDSEVALICTSGQLSGTAQLLVQTLVQNNIKVYYSGDLDPEGIGICDRLYAKYQDAVIPWRMDEDAYMRSLSSEKINDSRLSSLKNIQNKDLKHVACIMQQKKCAGYQENILSLYLNDLSYANLKD